MHNVGSVIRGSTSRKSADIVSSTNRAPALRGTPQAASRAAACMASTKKWPLEQQKSGCKGI
jgi:hypothetical protein